MAETKTPRLAIVGGGPKAAAIAAKSAVLRELNLASVDVTIYEPVAIGASWAGSAGYTDGKPPLCTIAERDLGFPYDPDTFGAATAKSMFRRFSWQSFAVEHGQGAVNYHEWVLRGRTPPTHRDFATYLQTTVRNSGATIVGESVVKVSYSLDRKWRVESAVTGGETNTDFYDGVVFTGTGPHKSTLTNSPGPPVVFNGHSVWSNLPVILRSLLKAHIDDRRIVIIGSGGTAAAVAYWLIRNKIEVPIQIVGAGATLFSRTPSYFEDRLFTTPSDWNQLPNSTKDSFIKRLTAGVVWEYVIENLNVDLVSYRSGYATSFVSPTPLSGTSLPGTPPPGTALIVYPDKRHVGTSTLLPASVFIDATGFDAMDFATKLDASLSVQLPNLDFTRLSVQDYLMVKTDTFPEGLHLPNCGGYVNPAAPNLMALGSMADEILRKYVPASFWSLEYLKIRDSAQQ